MQLRNLLAMSALLVTPAAAQTTIETTSFWNGANSISTFGKPNSATYGQSFTAPTDDVMQSFSFFLRDFAGGPDLEFQGYVSAWDGSQVSGPFLFTSAVRSGPAAGAGFVRYDFDVGGLQLTSGTQYIAFLSASGHFADMPVTSLAELGFVQTTDGTPYAGGMFRFLNNGDDLSLVSTTAWGAIDQGDLAFEMAFTSSEPSVVPEPGSVLLLATGMGLLLLGARFRRRSA